MLKTKAIPAGKRKKKIPNKLKSRVQLSVFLPSLGKLAGGGDGLGPVVAVQGAAGVAHAAPGKSRPLTLAS